MFRKVGLVLERLSYPMMIMLAYNQDALDSTCKLNTPNSIGVLTSWVLSLLEIHIYLLVRDTYLTHYELFSRYAFSGFLRQISRNMCFKEPVMLFQMIIRSCI